MMQQRHCSGAGSFLMHRFIRVTAVGLALVVVGFGVASCGDDEPAERKAFMSFLQTYVLNKPGVHVPTPTDADIKSFGIYADHYNVITKFTADPEMMAISSEMGKAVQAGAPRSLQEVVDRRQDVHVIRESMAKLRGALDQKFANAEAARDALKQPADLKAVFAAAFDRDVSDPARAFRNALPVVDEALDSVQKVAAFIVTHPKAVTISGSTVQVNDPKLRTEFNALLQGMNAKSQQLQDHQRRLRVVLTGS
jgi:hypothetical protein